MTDKLRRTAKVLDMTEGNSMRLIIAFAIPLFIGSIFQQVYTLVDTMIVGHVLGEHKGLIHYTIGQRKGLGISLGHPVFVTEIRPDTDEVVIGEAEDVFTSELVCNRLNFMAIEDVKDTYRALVKIRYSHKGAMATLERISEDEIRCVFDEPVRAVTPGQAVVFYEDGYILGGGTIVG